MGCVMLHGLLLCELVLCVVSRACACFVCGLLCSVVCAAAVSVSMCVCLNVCACCLRCAVLFEGLLLLCVLACAWVRCACFVCLCDLCVSVLNSVLWFGCCIIVCGCV